MEKRVHVNNNGDCLKEITVFNVPIGELRYVEAVLGNKTNEVAKVARKYAEDLEDDNPHELWTLLQYYLHHRITYWLRTCTPEETEEMADLVDAAILEVVHAATGYVSTRRRWQRTDCGYRPD